MIEVSHEVMKHWNIGLTMENIARAYRSGNRMNSNCFLVFDVSDQYVQLNISDLRLRNGRLQATINNVKGLPKNVVKVAVENGHLVAYYNEDDNDMAKIDLGNVTGPAGPAGTAATIAVGSVTTGAAGSNASVQNSGSSSAAILDFTIPRGNTGAKGDDGITPTFSVENGHLYVDYDNPYVPN